MSKNVIVRSVITMVLCSFYAMANPVVPPPSKTCGPVLSDRVSRICLPRGGYQRHWNHSRSKRSIVRECCWNVCPDSNILLYCSSENVEFTADSSSTTPSQYSSAIISTMNYQDDGAAEQSTVFSTNSIFLKSRNHGTISPIFPNGAIYVGTKNYELKVN